MGVRPWIAAVIAAAVGIALTACVLPLALRYPSIALPDLYYRFAPQASERTLAPIAFASHGYEKFHLLMPVFACRKWNGTPQPHEGQALKWVMPIELSRYPMPPADLPLIPFLEDLL